MRSLAALLCGALVGVLGGLIGLGGAEFRLPLLVGVFRYRILQAITINLAVSLATVAFSFAFRTREVTLEAVAAHAPIILNILGGSILGSFLGVRFATRVDERWLHRGAALLLIFLSFVLMGHEWLFGGQGPELPTLVLFPVALIAGLGIGLVSSMLGVAGGELIIPTIVLLFSVDIKLAGSLSLAISAPTILMGLWRYQHKQGSILKSSSAGFVAWMAAGSMAGAFVGTWLLHFVSSPSLHFILGAVLLASAAKMLSQRVA